MISNRIEYTPLQEQMLSGLVAYRNWEVPFFTQIGEIQILDDKYDRSLLKDQVPNTYFFRFSAKVDYIALVILHDREFSVETFLLKKVKNSSFPKGEVLCHNKEYAWKMLENSREMKGLYSNYKCLDENNLFTLWGLSEYLKKQKNLKPLNVAVLNPQDFKT